MNIPRLTSGPFCYSLAEWAIRMAFSDLICGTLLAAICFYLSSIVENYSISSDPSVAEAVRSWLIAIGVIICIPAIFSIVLIVGLFTNNKILHLIWCFFAVIMTVVFFILFIVLSIFLFMNSIIVYGILLLVADATGAGQEIYSILVVYSLYLNIKVKDKEAQTNNMQIGSP